MDLKPLTKINYFSSITRLFIYYLLMFFFILEIKFSQNLFLTITEQFFLGLVFAHGLQLQHECFHDNFFKNKKLNSFVGFLLGVPMLISFTHYRIQHLYHHKYWPTEKDVPIFDYYQWKINKYLREFSQALNIAKIYNFFVVYIKLIQGQYPSLFRHKIYVQKAFQEYSILMFIFLSAISFSLIYYSNLLLKVWFIPWLIFGEFFHFIIQLADHSDCDKNSLNIYSNTRSIKSNFWVRYIVNNNNYHVEHHLYPKVVFANLHLIHEWHKDKFNHFSPSYSSFLKNLYIKPLLKVKFRLLKTLKSLKLLSLDSD
ncbi:fatty acid desaturase family protein [Gloeothece verrucosa]|uniref:Fatty acid desaturase n=1 Tax=Gloeothece verrucosa (strain PCC 7822) TaxID=497965 RepID=E0UG90_GLOV7|nr:fatty acid desaturase [Gloeothece verrucosa]ADN16709.1 fatty acid desaturase [Gloeothece verrucosa PCC 7822]